MFELEIFVSVFVGVDVVVFVLFFCGDMIDCVLEVLVNVIGFFDGM